MTTTFRDQTWEQRYKPGGMGDKAEQAFENVWPYPWDRYGFNRPDVEVWSMPDRVRYTPDYITQIGRTAVLTEVQGCGQDGTHKFKADKLNALGSWNRDIPTTLWLWHEPTNQIRWISYPTIRLIIVQGKGTKGMFDGTKLYWAIHMDDLPDETETLLGKYAP
jgi:hypothetical protein